MFLGWLEGVVDALIAFDIDAALARKPAVLLVDELAHTNVEGSRHPKRWQDVEELLTAGVDLVAEGREVKVGWKAADCRALDYAEFRH